MTETARRYMGNSVPREEDPADLRLRNLMPASPVRVWQALEQACNRA
jgi:hypothetical protein